MKKSVPILISTCLLLTASGARAGDKHVVELFTSQGCYSCPPADRLLGKLIKSHGNIVALAFHVDYWDDLVYGLAGRWPDPFSDSAYTERQRRYTSRGLEGNNGVYTPQVVVNGRSAAVGSNKGVIERLLESPAPQAANVSVERDSGSMRVTVSGGATGSAGIWLFRFDIRNVTRIEGGENKGKTLTNHHVVTAVRKLGTWEGEPREYLVDDLYMNEDEGCAVLVQRPDQGEMLGAASCPS